MTATPTIARCPCGATVRMIPLLSGPGTGTVIPVDLGADPDGTLTPARNGSGAHPIPTHQLDTFVGPRYSPHWATCPKPAHWAELRRHIQDPTAPGPSPDRSGPCARCHTRHAARYGPGPNCSPLCPACRTTPAATIAA